MQLVVNSYVTVLILSGINQNNIYRFLKSKSKLYYKILYGKICILISNQSINLNIQNCEMYHCAIKNKKIHKDDLPNIIGNIIEYTKDNQ